MKFSMMKFKIYSCFIAVMVAVSSCDGLLDRFPLDKLSSETFLATEIEMQTYTNAF